MCFASRADAIPNARHGQLIASAETLALLSRPGDRPVAALTPPYGRPFTLGPHRLELFRSGSALGAAQLAVDVGGHRIVYAGAVHPKTAEVRPCDTLIIDAEYGHPHYAFPDPAEVAKEVAAFCADVTQSGGVAVLLFRRTCKVFDLMRAVAGPHLGHRSLVEPVRRVSSLTGLPPLRRATARPTPGHVLHWPVTARAALSGLTLPANSRIALVSGRALDPDFVRAIAADVAFPWSDRMGHEPLLGYVRASGAHRVFAVGRGAAALLQELPGTCDAKELAPPQQMALF